MKKPGLRHNLLQQAESISQLLSLFDLLPDVNFFVKDRQGRVVALNRTGCGYCGVRSQDEALGKTDHAFFSPARAAKYIKDDRRVMTTGQPMINYVEPAPEKTGSPRLVVVSKIPLRNDKGHVIGVAGVSRRIEQLCSAPDSMKKLAAAINYMHQNSSEALSTEQLAQMAGMSVSQFERSFRKTLGTTPHKYLLQVRITNACRLIAETDTTIATIALDCGFCDHAHFTRVFRQHTGQTPVTYRKRSRGSA